MLYLMFVLGTGELSDVVVNVCIDDWWSKWCCI
jgi:hypothetical protein